MSEPKAKPSEKITCPFCGKPIGLCDHTYHLDHARLAVKHARLVKAVRNIHAFVRDVPAARSRRMRRMQHNALTTITEALEDA